MPQSESSGSELQNPFRHNPTRHDSSETATPFLMSTALVLGDIRRAIAIVFTGSNRAAEVCSWTGRRTERDRSAARVILVTGDAGTGTVTIVIAATFTAN